MSLMTHLAYQLNWTDVFIARKMTTVTGQTAINWPVCGDNRNQFALSETFNRLKCSSDRQLYLKV